MPLVEVVSMLGPVLVVATPIIISMPPSLVAVVIPAAIGRPTVPEPRSIEGPAVIVIIIVIKRCSEGYSKTKSCEGCPKS
jgi:hypothetical protein